MSSAVALLFCSSSGAMYSGVPTADDAFLSPFGLYSALRADPKSASFTQISALADMLMTSTLAALMSRWMMPDSCRKDRPDAQSAIIFVDRFHGSEYRLYTALSEPYRAYSVINDRRIGNRQAPRNSMMAAWRSLPSSATSRRKSLSSTSLCSCCTNILTATSCPRQAARKTTPKLPWPMRDSSRISSKSIEVDRSDSPRMTTLVKRCVASVPTNSSVRSRVVHMGRRRTTTTWSAPPASLKEDGSTAMRNLGERSGR
mmetsp:Transcript_2864/g.9321  ORF Transcript_2864/g.9321 Transcript_2864/m.9321 type:complete len:258 (-) Transcript_2864:1478-2251(-)